jgi:hypothetical protein
MRVLRSKRLLALLAGVVAAGVAAAFAIPAVTSQNVIVYDRLWVPDDLSGGHRPGNRDPPWLRDPDLDRNGSDHVHAM